jgi:6-phosphogluconolactonase (cycloisomerase 2 family)
VVSRADTFVYVGGNGAVECYSIGPAGALTQVSGGGATVTGDVVSMATSPDGQWLIVLYYSTTTLATQAAVYGINATSGVLTLASAATVTFPSNYTFGTLAPKIIKISPAGNYIAAALGTAGDAFFSFNTTTGVLVQTGNVIPAQNSGTFLSDNAVQFDSASGYLFVGTTGLASGGSYITVYPISSSGALGTSSTITAGDSPSSLEFDSTGTYLYSANRGSANISGYTFSGGKLAAISGSPFGASTQVDALVRDKSGNYIFAAASSGGSTGANDVTMYGFDAYTSGKLDEVAVTASGTDPAGSVAIAATH